MQNSANDSANEESSGHSPEIGEVQVAVRCASGRTITVTANLEGSVQTLRNLLTETGLDPALLDPNLQLIFRGRILSELRCSLYEYGVHDGCCLLAVSARVRSANMVSQPQPQGAYGFERLRESGFTEDEIAQFRLQFFSASPSAQLLLGGGPLSSISSEDRLQQLRDLEEGWMNAQNEGRGVQVVVDELGANPRRLGNVEQHSAQDQHTHIIIGSNGHPVVRASNSERSAAVTGSCYWNIVQCNLGSCPLCGIQSSRHLDEASRACI